MYCFVYLFVYPLKVLFWCSFTACYFLSLILCYIYIRKLTMWRWSCIHRGLITWKKFALAICWANNRRGLRPGFYGNPLAVLLTVILLRCQAWFSLSWIFSADEIFFCLMNFRVKLIRRRKFHLGRKSREEEKAPNSQLSFILLESTDVFDINLYFNVNGKQMHKSCVRLSHYLEQ